MQNKRINFLLIILFFLISILRFSCNAESLSKDKIDYIKSKYEHKMYSKEHIFYPAKKAKRLFIFFNCAIVGRYLMWSWFWNNEEIWNDTAYLFLKDDDLTWYLGDDKRDFIQDFSNIINYYIKTCELSKDNVFTIGSSMGGYGAILYATLLGLKGAIVVNPQVNKASANVINDGTTTRINKIGKKWQNLESVIALSFTVPYVSLVYSHYPPDEAAGNVLINELKQKSSVMIVRHWPSSSHGIGSQVFSRQFIEDEIKYFENQILFLETKSLDLDEEV